MHLLIIKFQRFIQYRLSHNLLEITSTWYIPIFHNVNFQKS